MDNQKVKAIKRTVGMLAVCVLGAVLVHVVFTYIPLDVLGPIAMVAFVLFMINLVYQINLSRVKYEDQLNKTVNTFKE